MLYKPCFRGIGWNQVDDESLINYRVKLMEILNIRALKDPVYRNICIGQSFVNFSDITFFVLQPMLLYQYGYDTVSNIIYLPFNCIVWC